LRFLRLFRVGDVGIETARRYALIVAGMRASSSLAGKSKPDLWIAAWALEHNTLLVTRNVRHFADVPDLSLLRYSTSVHNKGARF
jgi:predicted nucleic acid-binding protein